MVGMMEEARTRFLARVEKQSEVTSPHVDSPCWLWTGSLKASGYGQTAEGDRAHRVALRLFRKPAGKQCVLHRCDVRHCVNPDHLFLGSRQDNADDMVRKARQVRGEAKWNARLSDADVLAIRERAAEGESRASIAKDFPVGPSQVAAVADGTCWAHVGGPRTSMPAYKLQRRDVLEIRDRVASGETYTAIASDFGVTRHAVRHVAIGKTWSDVQ